MDTYGVNFFRFARQGAFVKKNKEMVDPRDYTHDPKV